MGKATFTRSYIAGCGNYWRGVWEGALSFVWLPSVVITPSTTACSQPNTHRANILNGLLSLSAHPVFWKVKVLVTLALKGI